jgi:two-component system C4-dicarboxylate transport response regulator DctD
MAADEGEAAETARRPRRTVVVVEDDVEALEDIAELLEYEGFSVIACANAEQALVALAKTQQATLVTDIMMPGTDGITLARKAVLAFPEIRVVLMSGSDPNRGVGYDPAWAYLQKPINVDDLIEAILQR